MTPTLAGRRRDNNENAPIGLMMDACWSTADDTERAAGRCGTVTEATPEPKMSPRAASDVGSAETDTDAAGGVV
jgi:hypothetical protein